MKKSKGRVNFFLSLALFWVFFVSNVFAAVPVIDTLAPNSGPGNAPTEVEIKGNDFSGNSTVVASGGGLKAVGQIDLQYLEAYGADRDFDVAISGDYAYVADAMNGLVKINIQNKSNPRVENSFTALDGRTNLVTVSGSYAFVSTGRSIYVIDTTNLAYVNRFDAGGSVTGMAVYEGNLYVLDAGGRFRWLTDISNLPNLGKAAFTGDVVISGDYGYIGMDGGFKIYDIKTDPLNPILYGEFFTQDFNKTNAIAVSGDYAYIIVRNPSFFRSSLLIIDINEKSRPRRMGSYDRFCGIPKNIKVSGDYVFIASGTCGHWNEFSNLHVIDVKDPSNPLKAGGYQTSGYIYNIAVSGNYAYITDRDSWQGRQTQTNFHVIDITSPASPARLGEGDGSTGEARFIEISSDKVAWVGYREPMVDPFYLGYNPINPVSSGVIWSPGSETFDLKVSQNVTYVLYHNNYTGEGGLWWIGPWFEAGCSGIFNYQDWISDNKRGALAISETSDFAYVVADYNFYVVDITDKENPLCTRGSIDNIALNGVAVHGNHAFVGDTGYIRSIDVTDPDNILEVGKVSIPQNYYPTNIIISKDGAYAYVSTNRSFLIINISDPTALSLVGEYKLPVSDNGGDGSSFGNGVAWASAAVIDGNYAYIADGDVLILDIENPAKPAWVGRYDTPGIAYDVALGGGYLYVADNYAGLQVYDLINEISVTGFDPQTITAVIPAGLPEGFYDITVVNPDKNYGTLFNGFNVKEVSNNPPVANAGSDQIVEQTSLIGTKVIFNGLTSYDPDGDAITCEWTGLFGSITGCSVAVILQPGFHQIVLTVSDTDGLKSTDTVQITVQDTTSPQITTPTDITTAQTSPDGTPVSLGTPVVNDIVDPAPAITNNAPALFPFGSTTVTWRATDASGNYGEATQVVTIYVLGDLNNNGDIDRDDYNLFRSTLFKCEGDPSYIAEADYDGDSCITYADYRIWYGYFRGQ